jgi:hypothetical protein
MAGEGRDPARSCGHVVIHGLDITVPLGRAERAPDETIRAVLDHLTGGRTHTQFGFDLTGVRLQATDLEWSFGCGAPVRGTAADLALHICGSDLPPGRIEGTVEDPRVPDRAARPPREPGLRP